MSCRFVASRPAALLALLLPAVVTVSVSPTGAAAPRRVAAVVARRAKVAKPKVVAAKSATTNKPAVAAAKKITPPGRGAAVVVPAKSAPARSTPTPKPTLVASPAAASWWESAGVEVVAAGKGRINYEAGVVKAVGLGALPPPTLSRSRTQDALAAREAALADALRTLALAVSRVRVTATTRVHNYVLQDDEIKVRIEDVVRGAQVIEESVTPGGVYRVVLQTPLAGAGSVSEAVGVGDTAQTALAVETAPAPETKPVIEVVGPGTPPPPGATYTGLIVDCRGLDVSPSISPKLFDPDGGEVYGTMNVSPDYAIEVGIAGFPQRMDDARRSARIGDRPLIVRAARCPDRHRFYVVLRAGEAEKIREANRADKFLERTAVAFVVGSR